jgi:hypothetical protein
LCRRTWLNQATRLRRGLKNRITQADDTPAIGFTKKELHEMAEEVETSLAFIPDSYRKRLVAVRDRIDDPARPRL